MHRPVLALLALLALVAPAALACGNCENDPTQSCIINDRWPVKTLTDLDAGFVNKNPVDYTIAGYHALLRPALADGPGRDPEHRVFPEFTTFRISANLKWVGLRDDGDMHMAISDAADPTQTVVAEIPDASCVGPDLAPTVTALRETILQVTGPIVPGTTFTLTNVTPVVMTGVAFWDTNHGQTDQGPNYLELHPVIDVAFPVSPVSCPVPTTRSVSVCMPGPNSTISSPVRVLAAAYGTSVSRLSVAVDGVSTYSTAGNTVDTTLPVQPAGAHRVTVTAKDASGYYWKTVYFTVQ